MGDWSRVSASLTNGGAMGNICSGGAGSRVAILLANSGVMGDTRCSGGAG